MNMDEYIEQKLIDEEEIEKFVEKESKKLWEWINYLINDYLIWSREDLQLQIHGIIKKYEAMRRE